ncbi:MAG: tRNA(His) guanylyltransferase Thg1 family protein [Methanocellales archaeon]|nr:tRNA(His) guanylyltransferase Thg1 family protein [Methanocellales archaeon]
MASPKVMKQREIFSGIKATPPIAIRADGRNFKTILKRLNCQKPYDKTFAAAMADSAEHLMKESGLNPRFAYTFSDEINAFFLELPFQGRIEKLDSIVSSFLASALTLALDVHLPISFDARVIPLSKEGIYDYLEWRQAEAWRNHVHSYGYYTLLNEGMSRRAAASKLAGMSSQEIHDMLFKKGVNLTKTPTWQRRGILILKKTYMKPGYDPKKGTKVVTKRSQITQDWELPLFSSKEGGKLIGRLLVET